MNKKEFRILIDALINEIEEIPFDNYEKSIQTYKTVETFIDTHHEKLGQFASEGMGMALHHFDEMRRAKRFEAKRKEWSNGIAALVRTARRLNENWFDAE